MLIFFLINRMSSSLKYEIQEVKMDSLNSILNFVLLPDGDILFTNLFTNLSPQIFKFRKDSGEVTVYAGSGEKGNNDGLASQASFNDPTGLALLSDGSLIVADCSNHLIRHISPPSAKIRMVGTIAGDKSGEGFLDGPALSAKFNGPCKLCVDKNDDIFIWDYLNNRIRCLKDEVVSTEGGDGSIENGDDGNGDDGPALSIGLNVFLGDIACDTKGNIIFSTGNSSTVRKLDLESKIITTIAGKHNTEGNSDGNSDISRFCDTLAIAIDSADNIYVADSYIKYDEDEDISDWYTRIRKITPDGVTSTIVANEEKMKFFCFAMNFDSDGNLFVTGENGVNGVIFKIIILKNKLEQSIIKKEMLPSDSLMTHLFENPSTTKADIEFEVEGEIFLAHQIILMTQSSVMNALLTNNLKEKSDGKVKIEETTAAAFKALLGILYTGDKAKYCNDEVVCDLYFLSKKYMLSELESYCEFQIKKSSAAYLIDRFIWADAHEILSDLREHLKLRVAKNYNEIKEKYPDSVLHLVNNFPKLTGEIILLLNT